MDAWGLECLAQFTVILSFLLNRVGDVLDHRLLKKEILLVMGNISDLGLQWPIL